MEIWGHDLGWLCVWLDEMARKLRLGVRTKTSQSGCEAVEKSQMKEVNEMKRTLRKLYRGLKSRKGQSLVEYALILALIAVVAILVLRGLGSKVNNTLSSVNANLP